MLQGSLPTIVYVANADSREIIVLCMNGSGALFEVKRVPVAGMVMPLAIAPSRKFLYDGQLLWHQYSGAIPHDLVIEAICPRRRPSRYLNNHRQLLVRPSQ